MSTDKKYIHEVHSNEKMPQVIIYELTNTLENDKRIMVGTLEKVREKMKELNKEIEDDEISVEQLNDDESLFKYIKVWGFAINELTTVTLKDF